MKKLLAVIAGACISLLAFAAPVEIYRANNTATYVTVSFLDTAGAECTDPGTVACTFNEYDNGTLPGAMSPISGSPTRIGTTERVYVPIAAGEVDSDFTDLKCTSTCTDSIPRHLTISTITRGINWADIDNPSTAQQLVNTAMLLANSAGHGGVNFVLTGNRVALTSTSGPAMELRGSTNQPGVLSVGNGTAAGEHRIGGISDSPGVINEGGGVNGSGARFDFAGTGKAMADVNGDYVLVGTLNQFEGTVTAATANSITSAAFSSGVPTAYLGGRVTMLSGAADSATVQVTGFNPTNDTVTTTTFSTPPVAGNRFFYQYP